MHYLCIPSTKFSGFLLHILLLFISVNQQKGFAEARHQYRQSRKSQVSAFKNFWNMHRMRQQRQPPPWISSQQKQQSTAGFFYFSSTANNDRRVTQEGWITEQGDDMMLAGDQQDCSMYPNGTYLSPFAYSCATSAHPPILVIHESAFSNETGDYEYPLDLTQSLRIFLDVTSFATIKYDSMRAEVTFYRRKTGWLGCGWIYLPTFGLLDNLEVCEDGNPTCPVFPGRQVLELKIEPNHVFISFLKMVHNDRVPYQIKLRIINNRQHGEELLCMVFQSRIDI